MQKNKPPELSVSHYEGRKTKIASEETPMTDHGSSLPTPTQNLKILGVLSRNSYPILKTGDRGIFF